MRKTNIAMVKKISTLKRNARNFRSKCREILDLRINKVTSQNGVKI